MRSVNGCIRADRPEHSLHELFGRSPNEAEQLLQRGSGDSCECARVERGEQRGVDLVQIAKGSGLSRCVLATTLTEFQQAMEGANINETSLVVAKIEMGTIELPQYSNMDFKFNKYTFASYVEETEKIAVLRLRSRSPFTEAQKR